MGLANIFIELNQLDRAKRLLVKAIEIGPSFSESYNNLATIFINENSLNKAETEQPRHNEISRQ